MTAARWLGGVVLVIAVAACGGNTGENADASATASADPTATSPGSADSSAGPGPSGTAGTGEQFNDADTRVEVADGVLATWQPHDMSVTIANDGQTEWSGPLSVRIVHVDFDQDKAHADPEVEVRQDGSWTTVAKHELAEGEWSFVLDRIALAVGESRVLEARVAIPTGRNDEEHFRVTPYSGEDKGPAEEFVTAGLEITGLTPARGCRLTEDDEGCVGSVTVTNRADTPMEQVSICGFALHHQVEPGLNGEQTRYLDRLELRLGEGWATTGWDPNDEGARRTPLPFGGLGPRASRSVDFRMTLQGPYERNEGGSHVALFLHCDGASEYQTYGYVSYFDEPSTMYKDAPE